jgi:hypothetical protein
VPYGRTDTRSLQFTGKNEVMIKGWLLMTNIWMGLRATWRLLHRVVGARPSAAGVIHIFLRVLPIALLLPRFNVEINERCGNAGLLQDAA